MHAYWMGRFWGKTHRRKALLVDIVCYLQIHNAKSTKRKGWKEKFAPNSDSCQTTTPQVSELK
jgi:hypothetical protein